jgi:hypothetical protein
MVPNNVQLFLENPNVEFGYQLEVKNFVEDFMEKNKLTSLMDTLQASAALIGSFSKDQGPPTAGKFKSKYSYIPYAEDVSALQIDTSLTFKFHFGQYGLFSGEFEVVRPILSIASRLAPESLSLGSDPTLKNFVGFPVPSFTSYLSNLGSGIQDAIAVVNPFASEEDKKAATDDKKAATGDKAPPTDTAGALSMAITQFNEKIYS